MEFTLTRAERSSAHRSEHGPRSRRDDQQHPAARGASRALHVDSLAARSRRCARRSSIRSCCCSSMAAVTSSPRAAAVRDQLAPTVPLIVVGENSRREPHRRGHGPGRARRRLARQSGAPAGGDGARAALVPSRARARNHAQVRARCAPPARNRSRALERCHRAGAGRHRRRCQSVVARAVRHRGPRTGSSASRSWISSRNPRTPR